MAIFNSYVKLPEGSVRYISQASHDSPVGNQPKNITGSARSAKSSCSSAARMAMETGSELYQTCYVDWEWFGDFGVICLRCVFLKSWLHSCWWALMSICLLCGHCLWNKTWGSRFVASISECWQRSLWTTDINLLWMIFAMIQLFFLISSVVWSTLI